MDKIYIADLKDLETIKTIFFVKEKNISIDKKGHSYISMVLSDKTGQIDCRFWGDVDKVAESFYADDFVLIKGLVQKFQNRLQIIAHQIEPVDPNMVSISDYLPVSINDKEAMMENLLKILNQIKNPFIKKLIHSVLDDTSILPLFKTSPAAKSVHHAYIGGLLEHTLSICEIMVMLSRHYKVLDLDLLLFGAVFHDIGKIWELTFETHIGYTEVGRLVGHLQLGCELIEKKANEIANFPVDLKNICKHIVLSHHGKLEYGSPKRPKFLEAVVVAMIDDMDSKINSILTFMRASQLKSGTKTLNENCKWTSYSEMYDRYFYLGTLPREGDLEGLK